MKTRSDMPKADKNQFSGIEMRRISKNLLNA